MTIGMSTETEVCQIRGQAFSRFTLLNETPPKGYVWSGRRLTKIQGDITSRSHMPDAWTRIGKAAKRREKQEWAIEKPKLEYVRNLKRIYSIDPSDEDYKDIIKIARRELETPMAAAAAMPCKKRSPKPAFGKPLFRKRKNSKHLKQRQDSVVLLKQMHPQDKELISRQIGFIKVTLQGRNRIL